MCWNKLNGQVILQIYKANKVLRNCEKVRKELNNGIFGVGLKINNI